MKNLIFILVFINLCFVFGCKSKALISTNKKESISNCAILDSILTNKTLQKVLGIDTPKGNQPSIRFIDLKSKKFIGCEIMYSTPNTLPIEGFVIPEPTYSLNTGQFRDIVFLDYKETNDLVEISLTAAFLENQAEKEGIPFFEFNFIKDKKGNLYIDKVIIKQIRESSPALDYDKIKNKQ